MFWYNLINVLENNNDNGEASFWKIYKIIYELLIIYEKFIKTTLKNFRNFVKYFEKI